MREKKFTAGPWNLIKCDNGYEYEINAARWHVAVCCDAAGDGDTKANAALISAAPELLEALETCVNWYGAKNPKCQELLADIDEQDNEIRDAMIAIAKAYGEK